MAKLDFLTVCVKMCSSKLNEQLYSISVKLFSGKQSNDDFPVLIVTT